MIQFLILGLGLSAGEPGALRISPISPKSHSTLRLYYYHFPSKSQPIISNLRLSSSEQSIIYTLIIYSANVNLNSSPGVEPNPTLPSARSTEGKGLLSHFHSLATVRYKVISDASRPDHSYSYHSYSQLRIPWLTSTSIVLELPQIGLELSNGAFHFIIRPFNCLPAD
jgi:hypothetical protein